MNQTNHFGNKSSLVTMMIGTTEHSYQQMLQGSFNQLTFASDNLETVAHYFEGCAVELVVELEEQLRMEYAPSENDLVELGYSIGTYTFGSAEMKCPAGATWYSLSRDYLKSHIKSIKEIFPDLTPYNEED